MATVILPIAYSMISAQPITHAASSPKATYEYVYALPETGTLVANSAYEKAAKLHAMAVKMNRNLK